MSRNPKSMTVHMIGNAHLDPVWLWRWTEGYEALVATFRSTLDLMEEFEFFIFTSSSAATYDWIDENEPGMFEEIKKRVAEGRWQIVGGWWIQPDCNIPSGESFVRQGLYGQRYFERKLGVTATVGYNVDSFGHAGTLPQILAGMGLRSYIFFRPGPHEMELPEPVFWWEAPDGSRVLAHRPPEMYAQLDADVGSRIRTHITQPIPGVNDIACFYGVGNHGGGPTRAQLNGFQTADKDPSLPRVVCGNLDDFFTGILSQRRDYPVVKSELQKHAAGCYTAHAGIKRWNREAEALLESAEAFSVLASELTPLAYPHADITRAWEDVLFNQFHDILAGSSLPEGCEDARDLYGKARVLANRARWSAVQALSRRVNTVGEGQAVLAFNPLPWKAKLPIQTNFPFRSAPESFQVTRSDGHPISMQVVQSSTQTGSFAKQALWMDEVPPLGYRLYHLRKTQEKDAEPGGTPAVGKDFLENDFWRIEIDPEQGCISRLRDKRRGVEVFAGPAAVPLVLDDQSDTWGHGVSAYRNVVGRFENATVRIDESGPVRAALGVTATYGRSTITQVIRLYDSAERIEVDMKIDWHEQFRMLKLSFPVNVSDPVATASVPYGWLIRESNGSEETCGPWVNVSGSVAGGKDRMPYGLSVINDSKHGYDSKGSEIRLSVLRSPIYAWDGPKPKNTGLQYSFMDQGESRLRYWLVPHAGSWQKADVVRQALAINRPAIIVNEYAHDGPAPREWTGAESGPENVVLSVLKPAEDGEGLVLRLWETAGHSSQAWARLPELGARWEGTIRAHQIKTLLACRKDGEWTWRETDLLERPIDPEPTIASQPKE